MKLKIRLVGHEEFTAVIDDGRTFKDIYNEMSDYTSTPFILVGNKIIQKTTVQDIENLEE